MRNFDNANRDALNLPELPYRVHETDRLKLRDNDIASAVISVYELKNLFLYDYLQKEYPTVVKVKAESLIRGYIGNFNRFIKNFKADSNLPLVDPPDFRKNAPLPFVKNDKDATKTARKAYNEQQIAMEKRREDLRTYIETTYKIPYNAIPDDIREYLLAYHPPQYRTQVETIAVKLTVRNAISETK